MSKEPPQRWWGCVSLCSCCSAISVSSAAQRYHLIICKGTKVKFRVNKHFSFFSILCLYKAFQEAGRRPCSQVSFSQWPFLSGEGTGLRGSLGHWSGGFSFYVHVLHVLHSPWLKKKIPGQCPFLWHGADTRNEFYLCETYAEIFYSKGFLCTETFHAERTKPLVSLERTTGPYCAFLFLATHSIFLYWIKYQAQYHAEKGIHLRSECWCLAGLIMSVKICFQRWLHFTGKGTFLVIKNGNVRGLWKVSLPFWYRNRNSD